MELRSDKYTDMHDASGETSGNQSMMAAGLIGLLVVGFVIVAVAYLIYLALPSWAWFMEAQDQYPVIAGAAIGVIVISLVTLIGAFVNGLRKQAP